MPVEIRELVIRMTVDDAAGKGNTGAGESQDNTPEAIIKTCVEKVMEILKDQRER
ncbi:DUF5908 family protein [Chitinophaga nivalis]|uniref:DUF5908 family protein n=1 Tax=Chitinophaga nivalis TaxID=2991709 RepID=A0ABT3IP47_9BACT|nr:DUF5908 family protein [Chitinophaga nivalis]MCW3464567.1 DUF5908 family protein [Chitinophaga nivalis]MCW3485742.1 DUF5908 family protein [Chitinophaga nivalis]